MSLTSSNAKLNKEVDQTVRRAWAAMVRDLEQLYLLLGQGEGGLSNESPGSVSQDVTTDGMGVEGNQGDYRFSGPASINQVEQAAAGLDLSAFVRRANDLSDINDPLAAAANLGALVASYSNWSFTQYLTPGSFTHTFNVNTKAVFFVITGAGGGGGGGATSGNPRGGCGGASGGVTAVYSGPPSSSTSAVVVGAGGTGGAAGSSGTTGGATSAVVNGATITAAAGFGGGTAGGTPGVGFSGSITPSSLGYTTFIFPGESGQPGYVETASLAAGPLLSVVARGGRGGRQATTTGGGAGGDNSFAGNDGGGGSVTIYEAT